MASPAFEVVGAGGPDGVVLGGSSSELVGFHGIAPPTDQYAFFATVTATFVEGSVSASALVGFSRGTMSNALTLLNNIQALLTEKGLMASS